MNALSGNPASFPTDHATAVARAGGAVSDSKLSKLQEVRTRTGGPSPQVTRAVAQMIVTDGGRTHVDEQDRLHLPYVPLNELALGKHHLCADAKSDFNAFAAQPCISGSTAVLISPRHVLTAAHAVMVNRIVAHQFVFDRTLDATHLRDDPENKEFVVERPYYSTARSLVAYVKTPYHDWAVLELYDEVEHDGVPIQPLGLGRWNPTQRADFVGHPLGLPVKYADVQPTQVAGNQTPNFLVDVDNASGGSGGPLIQSGMIVGIMRGAAKLDPMTVIEHNGHKCVDPTLGVARPQPFTPVSSFADCLSHLIGW